MDENQMEQQNNEPENEGSGFDIKQALPILLVAFIVILFFAKLVLPALNPNVDHGATAILESEGRGYESLFKE